MYILIAILIITWIIYTLNQFGNGLIRKVSSKQPIINDYFVQSQYHFDKPLTIIAKLSCVLVFLYGVYSCMNFIDGLKLHELHSDIPIFEAKYWFTYQLHISPELKSRYFDNLDLLYKWLPIIIIPFAIGAWSLRKSIFFMTFLWIVIPLSFSMCIDVFFLNRGGNMLYYINRDFMIYDLLLIFTTCVSILLARFRLKNFVTIILLFVLCQLYMFFQYLLLISFSGIVGIYFLLTLLLMLMYYLPAILGMNIFGYALSTIKTFKKKKMKSLIVFGTRPEAIKMAPLVKALQAANEEVKICVTAQHREMLDQVLEIFEIVPDYDLDIMQPNQDLISVTTKVMSGIKTVIEDYNPDKIFVHGDTTTSTATATAAMLKQIDVIHIEAGLRTGDVTSPYPEEYNRKITASISSCNFAPTQKAKENLLLENVSEETISVSGNTVTDSILFVSNKINNDINLQLSIVEDFKKFGYQFSDRKIISITAHRRENFGEPLLDICKAIRVLAEDLTDIDFVYPVHPNPNIQEVVKDELGNIENVYLLKPLDYLNFSYLMMKSTIILTDSGGIQEEAPTLNIPVLILREVTERPEAVESGCAVIVGTDSDKIINTTKLLIHDEDEMKKMQTAQNPFGDGKVCNNIMNSLKKDWYGDIIEKPRRKQLI